MSVRNGVTVRGTSNGNERGSAEQRRRRKAWLVETYRANQDMGVFGPCKPGWGEPACRCYRCGVLLTVADVTVDRIVPGCLGGTYRRDNIRPACGDCNSETGGAMAHGPAHQARKVARKAPRKSRGAA